jgi:hypothetical protein
MFLRVPDFKLATLPRVPTDGGVYLTRIISMGLCWWAIMTNFLSSIYLLSQLLLCHDQDAEEVALKGS